MRTGRPGRTRFSNWPPLSEEQRDGPCDDVALYFSCQASVALVSKGRLLQMRTVHGILTIVAVCAACGTPATQSTANTAAGNAAADQAHEAYVTAINSNNLDSILGMLTEDVVFLSAHEAPMVGKAAVRPWLEAYVQAYKAHWDKPVQEKCPQCGKPFLLEKTMKKGTTRRCADEECGYKSDLMPPPPAEKAAAEKRA